MFKNSTFRPGNSVNLTNQLAKDLPSVLETLDKNKGAKIIASLQEELKELQSVLYANSVTGVAPRILIIVQGMDTSGKDGSIKAICDSLDPHGYRVISYKKPTKEEASKPYLWRIAKNLPSNGEIVIFNRSHYEDIMVPTINKLIPADQSNARIKHVNDFERMLVNEDTVILKFFTHISKEEQLERLQARLTDTTKNWKFNPGDLDVRKQWEDYMNLYNKVLLATSTTAAPWHIVPSNKKWVRNLIILQIVVNTLKTLHLNYPTITVPPASSVV